MNFRILELCKEQGINQTELAEKIGLSRVGLSKAINGNPTVETLSKIANALEVEIPDLFERKKEEENTIICPKCGSKFKLIE
jgi:transcriptional regulator with XRE-family HTH domain